MRKSVRPAGASEAAAPPAPAAAPEEPARISRKVGSIGSTHGETKEAAPARNAAPKEIASTKKTSYFAARLSAVSSSAAVVEPIFFSRIVPSLSMTYVVGMARIW